MPLNCILVFFSLIVNIVNIIIIVIVVIIIYNLLATISQ